MNAKLFLLLSLGLIWLVGCGQTPPPEPTPAPTATAAAESNATPTAVSAGVTILADGVIQSEQPALPLGFEVGGTLLSVAVQAGDTVQAGDVLALLDDTAVQDAAETARLQLAQSENSLAQSRAELDKLLNWEPDALAVAQAEANLAAAEAALANAQSQDAVAGSSATQARVSVEQAERALADAQDAYDTAYDPGREWELGDRWRADLLKNERKAAERGLEVAQEQLEVARANFAVAAAGVNNDTAVSAEANVASARQALDQAQRGPNAEEITLAQLRVEQAEIALAQSQLSLSQAEANLADVALMAPWTGVVLAVDAAPGTLVGSGTAIITLLDVNQLAFHTTNLSERDLAQIAPGQAATVTLKAYPDAPLTGTVARIGYQAGDVVGDAVTFPVIITLDAADLAIRPGMTGRAEIQP